MTHERLHSGFLRTAEATPDRPALHVDGMTLTYQMLRSSAASIAATLQSHRPPDAPAMTAVFAERSRTAFAGILGVLLAGHSYVPLNPAFPISRTRRMLELAGCRSLIVDERAEKQLDGLLDGCAISLLIILPDREVVRDIANRWPRHVFVGAADLAPARWWVDRPTPAGAPAYLLFTSGSTGDPKGVSISHRNAVHFIRTVANRYDFTADDRFSQMFDTTFDLSVFDLFAAWYHGACVYCPSRAMLLNPDRFVREHALTVWFSVPTLALLMQRFGAVKPGRYPSLRWSLFCGEPLTVGLARAWAAAAPQSMLENLYGPTELTVACTAYGWDPRSADSLLDHHLIPIGFPHPGMKARVIDARLRDVRPGRVGELWMAGPQCAAGYWRDRKATAAAFRRLPDSTEVYYRTGDRVRLDRDGALHYVGRVDHQIKIMGHRVELGEIESVLRQEPGVQQAVAVLQATTSSGRAGVVAFVTGSHLDPPAIRASLYTKLQAYAVPQAVHVLSALPQNANGKVDRRALLNLLNV